MNKWGIPDWLEQEVRERDKCCVYCGVRMIEKTPPQGSRKNVASWEHIVNDVTIIDRENIVLCCVACNASKGAKTLTEWLQSTYCKEKGITKDTVTEIVKNAFSAAQRYNETHTMQCPHCKSTNTIPIAYGYPGEELWREVDAGRVKLGGCCVEEDNPDRFCKDCEQEFLTKGG